MTIVVFGGTGYIGRATVGATRSGVERAAEVLELAARGHKAGDSSTLSGLGTWSHWSAFL